MAGRKPYTNMQCAAFRASLRKFIANEIQQRGEEKHNRLWVRLTVNEILEHYPDKSWRQVTYALHYMLDVGLLNSGQLSENKLDRACWYSLEV